MRTRTLYMLFFVSSPVRNLCSYDNFHFMICGLPHNICFRNHSTHIYHVILYLLCRDCHLSLFLFLLLPYIVQFEKYKTQITLDTENKKHPALRPLIAFSSTANHPLQLESFGLMIQFCLFRLMYVLCIVLYTCFCSTNTLLIIALFLESCPLT